MFAGAWVKQILDCQLQLLGLLSYPDPQLSGSLWCPERPLELRSWLRSSVHLDRDSPERLADDRNRGERFRSPGEWSEQSSGNSQSRTFAWVFQPLKGGVVRRKRKKIVQLLTFTYFTQSIIWRVRKIKLLKNPTYLLAVKKLFLPHTHLCFLWWEGVTPSW